MVYDLMEYYLFLVKASELKQNLCDSSNLKVSSIASLTGKGDIRRDEIKCIPLSV